MDFEPMKKTFDKIVKTITGESNDKLIISNEFDECEILHFKHKEKKLIYLLILGKHVKDLQTFNKIFTTNKPIAIKEREFDRLYRLGHEIVTIGDKEIIDDLFNDVKDQE